MSGVMLCMRSVYACFICACVCAYVCVVRAKTLHVFVKFCFGNKWSLGLVYTMLLIQLSLSSWKHLFRKGPAGAPEAKPEDASNAAPTGEMVAVDPVHGESDEHELPWQVRW